ncbi:MAG: hypothetical protein K2N27_04935 [Ruminococcus sp.]|nr:hypothetical protein [Ruminococcus sp.]
MISITEIQSITEHCMKILSCTEYLRRDTATKEAYTFAEGIFGSIRKLFIASMMYNKMLICVSGLQGAGKTTLMRNFYHLDSKFLDPTRGRGERVPVLITEKSNIKVPKMFAIRIDKDMNGEYYQQSVELSAEEYMSASRGEDSKIMYLELLVPYTHTFNEGISFMLLPGFEKKNDYWNNLIEFSVNSSDAAVFVFNETSFSNAENDRYLSRIEDKFGKNLVYAISGSDGSTDDNAEFKQTCIITLNLPINEADRVICVGSYANEEKNLAWIKKFKDALEKYAYRETQQFQRNSTYLYNEVLDIKEKLYQILNILNDDSTAEMKDHRDDTLLRAFDKAVKKKRKEFEENLDIEFEIAKGESGKNLERLFTERPKIGAIKRFFFGSSVKEQFTETRKMVQKSLQYNGNCYLPDKHLGLALQRSLIALDQPENRTDISRLIDTKNEDGKTLLLTDSEKTQAMAGDICNLLADNSQGKINYTLQSTSPKKVLGAVAELSTYYYSLVSYNEVAESTGLSYYEPSQTQLVPDRVIDGAKSSKKFVAGMAGMMGIDLIGDGSINMVSQIAASLGVAAPVAGAAAIAIIGAGAASVVMKDLNRMQREDFQSARLAVNGVYDDLKIDALRKFDIYMERIKDRIEDNLTELSGDGKKVIVEHNTKIEVNNALNLLDKIFDRYAGDVYGVESAFS